MDVTSENFDTLFPTIKESIENADFFAIDCELTGLQNLSYCKVHAHDTIEQYYQKTRRNCKDFLPIQFGLSTFRYEKSTNVFKENTYNFYIFRSPHKYILNQIFSCTLISIHFLISQDFDFNKLFKYGLSYLNDEEEEYFQKRLEEELPKTDEKQKIVEIPSADQPFIDEIMEKIKTFLNSDTEDSIRLPKCNPFLRKLIYQTTEELFGNEITLKTITIENKDKVLEVTKTKDLQNSEKIEQENTFETLLGFTKVMKLIVKSEKLIVGHNMMIDLLHVIDKFLTPLPEDYKEFKECAHCLLPRVIDTKYISSSDKFKDIIKSTVLGDLLQTVQEDPFVIPSIESENNENGYSLNNNKQHEAGYDAYITGISFIALWKYLGDQKKLSNEDIFSNHNLLGPFINRLYLMRLLDNPHINLGGKDPKLIRNHIFHVVFPKSWKIKDLQQLFSPFGNIFVSWVDDVSAFVCLYKRDQSNIAYAALKKNTTCKVVPYDQWFKNQLSSKQDEESSLSGLRRKIEGIPLNSPKKIKVEKKSNNGKTSSSDSAHFQASNSTKDTTVTKTFAESEWD